MRKTFFIFWIVLCAVVIALIVNKTIETTFPAKKQPLVVTYSQLTKPAQAQIDCLADNIYYEAGFEPVDGQIAVALVTLNRVNDDRYPNTICGVVKQKTKTTCQFSWVCERAKSKANEVYARSKEIALFVYSNYENLKDITLGSLFYHADYVNPRWKLERTVVIGRHIFYKESESEDVIKTKSAVEGRRRFETFLFPYDGGDKLSYLQASN